MRFGPWELIGAVGVLVFGSRFIVQWIVSEKRKQSVMPVAFWYLSLGGCVFQLAYFLHKFEWIGVAGQILMPVVYIRNLVLIRRKQALEATPENPIE